MLASCKLATWADDGGGGGLVIGDLRKEGRRDQARGVQRKPCIDRAMHGA